MKNGMNKERCMEILNSFYEELSADLVGTFSPGQNGNEELGTALLFAHDELKMQGHANVLALASEEITEGPDYGFHPAKSDVAEDLEWYFCVA